MKQQISPALAGVVIAVVAVLGVIFVMRAFGGPGKTPPKPANYDQLMKGGASSMQQNRGAGGSMGGRPGGSMGSSSMGGAPR